MSDEILRMIETVDPSDTAKLDEIDARVRCFLEQWEFDKIFPDPQDHRNLSFYVKPDGTWPTNVYNSKRYTRSRDALKAIRPDEYAMRLSKYYRGSSGWSECELVSERSSWQWGQGFLSKPCKTEELAELHAIIQAIEFERTQK